MGKVRSVRQVYVVCMHDGNECASSVWACQPTNNSRSTPKGVYLLITTTFAHACLSWCVCVCVHLQGQVQQAVSASGQAVEFVLSSVQSTTTAPQLISITEAPSGQSRIPCTFAGLKFNNRYCPLWIPEIISHQYKKLTSAGRDSLKASTTGTIRQLLNNSFDTWWVWEQIAALQNTALVAGANTHSTFRYASGGYPTDLELGIFANNIIALLGQEPTLGEVLTILFLNLDIVQYNYITDSPTYNATIYNFISSNQINPPVAWAYVNALTGTQKVSQVTQGFRLANKTQLE